MEFAYLPDRDKWRRRNAYFYADVLKFFRYAVPEGSRVLELGVDDGWLLHSLHPSRGVYLGASRALNEQGQKKYPKLTFVDDDWLVQPALNEKFDYIVLPNVVGWVSDLQPFFARLQNFANARSKVVVTYYNHLWEPALRLGAKLRLKQKQPVQNWLTTEDIALLLELSGFEVIKKGRRLLIPKYIPLLSWAVNSIIAKLPLLNRLNFWNYVVARPGPNFQKPKDYSVSVVIPARNEKGNIEEIVRRVPAMGKETEIIFVEGGSTDGTWEEIKRVAQQYGNSKKIRFFQQEGKGKGDAVRKGFSGARGDILMILDADLSVPPEELPRFYEILARGQAEYAQGNRLVYPRERQAMRLLNLAANKFFGLIFSWLLNQRIKDTLCGTKGLFREDYRKLARSRGYFGDFDPFGDFDLIFGAQKLNLKMVEIPVHYKERKYGATNISRFRHGFLLLKMCLFAMRKIE